MLCTYLPPKASGGKQHWSVGTRDTFVKTKFTKLLLASAEGIEIVVSEIGYRGCLQQLTPFLRVGQSAPHLPSGIGELFPNPILSCMPLPTPPYRCYPINLTLFRLPILYYLASLTAPFHSLSAVVRQ